MTARPLVIACLLTMVASTARAEIYEWQGPDGARHFTNNKAGVPSEYASSAHVLIADWPAPPASDEPRVAPPAVPAPPAAAETVSDDPGWREAYIAGLQAGMTMGGGGGGGGGTVQINGPLAVATSREVDSAPGYGFYPPWPWYYPFVTTGFDGGRSRHQTLRMLLQDQFQLDRDGPFAYERWNQPGLGPALAPFLNRGLPFPVQQYGRVIYR